VPEQEEIHSAKHSVYDTDFAVVYSAALQATREAYASVDDYPGTGTIKTAWHQVSYANNQDDLSNQRTVAQSQGLSSGSTSQSQAAAGMPTRLAYKRQFVRFDITIAGGGRGGSRWSAAPPSGSGQCDADELRGMARPAWLDGRTEALQVAIYRKMKRYALPMKEEVEIKTGPVMPTTDPSTFKDIPPEAASRSPRSRMRSDVATIRRSAGCSPMTWCGASRRTGCRHGDGDVAGRSGDARPMARAIAAGCGAVEKRVACPVGAPVAGAWQLLLEPRPTVWKVASFVKAE